LCVVAVGKTASSTEESIMVNLALTDQFGMSHVHGLPSSLQSGKRTLRAERFLWVPAAILALGVLKKYAAFSSEHFGQVPEGTVAAQHHPDFLTRVREAGW